MEQNIISLGFNVAEFTAEQKVVYEASLKTYQLLKEMDGFKISVGGSGAGWAELKKHALALELQLKKLQEENLKLTQSILEGKKAAQDAAKATKEKAAADREAAKATKEAADFEKALEAERKKGISTAAAEAKIAAQLCDEYGLLSKSLKEQELRYKNLALVHGIESTAAKEALKTALDTRAVLDKLDTNLKNHQRNVGNYKSAFDGLGMSFSQVARELPSLTVSAQQFFLAISNNLPMVFDEVKKAKAEIAALKAEGQAAPSLMSRIGKSLFSWNIALAVGITLLTAFGSKIADGIKGWFGYSDAQEKAAQAVDKLVQAELKLIETMKESNALVFGNVTNVDRLEKELQISEALGKSRGDILKTELEIAKIKDKEAISAYNISGGQQKLADLQFDLIGAEIKLNELITAQSISNKPETFDKDIQRAQNKYNLAKRLAEDQLRIVKDNYDAGKAVEQKQNELIRYNAEQRLSIEIESAKIRAQTIINANERILNDERNFEKKRAEALISSAEEKKRSIEAELRKTTENPANKNADGTYTAEAINAQKAAAAEKLKIDKDLQVALFNNSEEFRKRKLAAELEIQKAEIGLVSDKNKLISESEVKSFDERIVAFGNHYLAERDLIEKEAAYQLATTIKTAEEQLALTETTNKKLIDLAIKYKKELSNIFVSNETSMLALAESLDKKALAEQISKDSRAIKNKQKRQEAIAQLEYQSARDALNNAIYADQAILNSSTTTAEAKAKAQIDLNNKLAALYKLDTDHYIAEEDKKLAKKKAIEKMVLDFVGEMNDRIVDLVKASIDSKYEKELKGIQDLIDANNRLESEETERINNSTLSEQDKAAKLIQLNATVAAKNKQLAQEEREIRIKQAQFDKAAGVAKIILNTAVAVTSALSIPIYGEIQAAIIAALGAAELAVALATPIPTYAEGTDHHPGGPAIYGEGKHAELVSEPGKRPYVVDKATLGILPVGTKVKPLTGDYINEQMYGSMITSQAERLAIAEAVENKRSDTAWKIARWQTQELKEHLGGRKQAIHINNKLDMGFAAYINKQIFGR